LDIQLKKSTNELTEGFLSLSLPQDIASLLEIPYKVLNYHLYVTKPSEQYTTFSIPKKHGGIREICAPNTTIKIIQQKLNFVLQNVYKKIYERKFSVHGFIYGKNIRTNAQTHSKKEYVFNIDFLDFFPSINFGRVYGMFMNKPYNLPQNVSAVLARICAFKDLQHDQLPQGAPTSPIISNMICARMDDELYRFAKEFNCRYTRYADDITFSTDRPNFPEELAIVTRIRKGQRLKAEVGKELITIIENNGFSINPNKVWIRNRYTRQEVTGLVVNEFPNVSRKYINQIRAMLHAWEKYGLGAAEKEFLDEYDRKKRWPFERGTLYKQIIKGKINFLKMVRGNKNQTYLKFGYQLAELDPDFSEFFKEQIKQQNILNLSSEGAGISKSDEEFDAFLCHASEDRKAIVRPFAEAMRDVDLRPWIDEGQVKWGDNLVSKIQGGLARSRFVVVFLSEAFLAKKWTEAELNTAISMEIGGKTVVLPVLLGLTRANLQDRYPMVSAKVNKEVADYDHSKKVSKKKVQDLVAELKKLL